MTNRYLAFDIEIAKVMTAGETDWKAQRPLGISCAATFDSADDKPMLWYSTDEATGLPMQSMTVEDVQDLVCYLRYMANTQGYKVLTWNGLAFDFDILAEESCGMSDHCVDLALNHIDMMFQVFALRGHYLGLGKASKGMGLAGKLNGVNGADAPKLWSQGQQQQVLQYVAQDVRITLQVAQAVDQCKEIRWTSDKGRPNVVEIDRWLTVTESLRLPEPDTSWMDSPPTRAQLMAWTQVATSRPSKRVVNHMERVFDALRLKGEEVPLRDAYWLKQWQRLLSNWN